MKKRGWTLDVFQVVQSLKKKEFLLSDVYAHADTLAKLHPQNADKFDVIRVQVTHNTPKSFPNPHMPIP